MPVKMKKFFIFLNYFLICITPVFADQFGMLYGMFTSPTGETRLYSNGDEVALKSNKPTTGLLFGLENLRVSYLEYQMTASQGGTTTPANMSLGVQVLAFEYQKLFPYEGYYFHAGLANFASQFEYSYGNSSDVNNIWNLDYRGSTNKVFDIGLILGIGLQFDVSQKGFIGADLTMIPKKEVEYEYKSHSNITVSNLDEKIDLGVTVIGIFAGLNF